MAVELDFRRVGLVGTSPTYWLYINLFQLITYDIIIYLFFLRATWIKGGRVRFQARWDGGTSPTSSLYINLFQLITYEWNRYLLL